MTNEQMQKAKECKSAEELLALAKENGMEMSAEEAAERYAQLHNEGELSDDELDSAAGGGSCGKQDVYHPQKGERVRVINDIDKCPKCGGMIGVVNKVCQPGIGCIDYILTCENPACGNKNWKVDCLIECNYFEKV